MRLIMEFFDKLTKKATETYKGAAEKTGKIAKEAKLKLKINENKSKINDLYEEIGKKVYQKHTADEELSIKEDLKEQCGKIDELSQEIENYHKEILTLSNIKLCVNCKEEMEKDDKFCSKCGAEQPDVEPAKDIEVEVIEEKPQEDSSKSEEVQEENSSKQEEDQEENNDNEN